MSIAAPRTLDEQHNEGEPPRSSNARRRQLRGTGTRRRAPWRQWLVEAERGLTFGFRSDSIFFVHLFTGSLAIAAAALLGLTAAGWAILVLALGMAVSAELFHQLLKQLGTTLAPASPQSARTIRRFGTAATAIATLTSGIAIAILLIGRLWGLFSG